MNSHLAALRESIIAETVAACPDFHFLIAVDPDGNLTVDYRGTWETPRTPEPDEIPFFTVEHDGDRFLVSRYRWNDRKKYKTLKGAARYVNDELQAICMRRREQKAEDDAKREHNEKSVEMLRELQERLDANGIKSKLCLVADRYHYDHLCIDADRVNTRIDITVSSDYRLEFAFSYPRFYTAPETALDILSVLSKEKTA